MLAPELPPNRLSDDERSRLIRICWDHEVAVCGTCSREYRLNEMGADLFSGQYYLCPFCQVDLVPSIRRHITECAGIRPEDPQWQAGVRETLTCARETRKTGGQLQDASELARVESEVLQARAQETAEAARQAQRDAQRIKREPPAFRCSLCGHGIQPDALVVFGLSAVHAACLELGDASDLALIGHRFDQDGALGYKGYRLEFRSYLNQDSRRWVPKVVHH